MNRPASAIMKRYPIRKHNCEEAPDCRSCLPLKVQLQVQAVKIGVEQDPTDWNWEAPVSEFRRPDIVFDVTLYEGVRSCRLCINEDWEYVHKPNDRTDGIVKNYAAIDNFDSLYERVPRDSDPEWEMPDSADSGEDSD